MTANGLRITPPSELGPSQYAWTFEIATDENQHHPNAIARNEDKALKGTGRVDLEGHHSTGGRRPAIEPFVAPGATMMVESASRATDFHELAVRSTTVYPVVSNQPTTNDPLLSLTDGRLSKSFGPVFRNGVRNGAYKMDLGAVEPVSSITSWSHHQAGKRGSQKLSIYGNAAPTDPGWDLRQWTLLGTVDTGPPKERFTAASLRAARGKALGKFRWIAWAVSPVSEVAGGENTAFQELGAEILGESSSQSEPLSLSKPKPKVPNIVLPMMFDQYRADSACDGWEHSKRLDIEKLAYHAVVFADAHCVDSMGMPSRTAMTTRR